MSSLLALPHPAASSWESSRNQATPDRYTEDGVAYGQRRNFSGSSWFGSGLPTPPSSRAMTAARLGEDLSRYSTNHANQSGQYYQKGYSTHSSSYGDGESTANSTYQHSQPSQQRTSTQRPETEATHTVASYLQIPESVNKSKGNLAEFAAEITCLFWFESSTTLQFAESLPNNAVIPRGLVPDALPTVGFRKWVTTILSTTQVGKNVILLALMFIYRLKKFNPSVSGKRGSEFRLLTIALMLGNKFLDDNTYTNKTWAEVSGISVNEIHIMEVEFLSNMRYDLYASEEEWKEWKMKLGKLGAYYEKASQLPVIDESRSAAPITPLTQSFPQKFASPPSTHRADGAAYHFGANNYSTLPNPLTSVPHLSTSPQRRQRNSSIGQRDRKRSLESTNDSPPAKRHQYHSTSSFTHANTSTSSTYPANYGSSGDLDKVTGRPQSTRVPSISNSIGPLNNPNLLSQLAPLNLPNTRAMASVYPPSTSSYSQPITPISAIPPNINGLFQATIPNLGDPSRPQSTHSSARTSPTGSLYNVATPMQQGSSPSYFLTHRSSPYRPVRHVNTLLIPPPSAALQNQVRPILHDQMHYQPLGKSTSDRRSGPVPYMQPDAWQGSASTPLAQQYRYRL